MGYSVSQSLISSPPPLIVFTLCLTAFGFTMIVLAYVIGETEIPNPDVKMDWNKYLNRIADLRLCPIKNYTRNANGDIITKNHAGSLSALNSSHLHVVDESKSMSAVLSGVVDLAMDGKWHESMFIDVSVSVKIKLRGKLPKDSPFSVKGQVKGSLLGFTGKYGRLLYNVSLNFLSLPTDNCTHENCYLNYEVCITMSWPADFLPKTKGPEKCIIKESSNSIPVLFTELPLPKQDSSNMCLELKYIPDAKLTEMLSLQERSIVNLHLMHTSYFMFVMVMTLICYSLIKGRSRPAMNYTSLQKALDS